MLAPTSSYRTERLEVDCVATESEDLEQDEVICSRSKVEALEAHVALSRVARCDRATGGKMQTRAHPQKSRAVCETCAATDELQLLVSVLEHGLEHTQRRADD